MFDGGPSFSKTWEKEEADNVGPLVNEENVIERQLRPYLSATSNTIPQKFYHPSQKYQKQQYYQHQKHFKRPHSVSSETVEEETLNKRSKTEDRTAIIM